MIKKISILLFLSIFFVNCKSNIVEPKISHMSVKIGEDPLEIIPVYYKNNEDYYLDDVSLNVQSKYLLKNKFDLDFEGTYGEKIKFLPKQPGSYDLKLIVQEVSNGKQIDVTNYRIDVTGSPLLSNSEVQLKNIDEKNPLNEKSPVHKTFIEEKNLKQADSLEVSKKITSSSKYIYYLQISAWNKEQDAILAKNNLTENGNKPFIEKYDKNNLSIWRVRFGPFISYEDAKNKSDELNLDNTWIEKVLNQETVNKTIEVENLIDYEEEQNKTIEVENLIDYEEEQNKTIEVENLIDYEEEQNKTIEVENLIDYEEEQNKTIEVENLIDYEEEQNKTIEVENLIDYEEEKNKTIEVENLIDYEEEKNKTIEVEDLISYENTEDHKKDKNDQEYFIQVKTSSSLNKIEENKKYLESYGYNPFIQKTEGKNNRIWYKLKLGPYNFDKADSISNEIFENLGLETRINNE